MKNDIKHMFAEIRHKNPLVHQITNQVTMNDCANATLAIGASPVMASSPQEVKEMVGLADALVVNIGTLQSDIFEGMLMAGEAANRLGVPVIFDPVGAGSTSFRSDAAVTFLERVKVAAIRGNASEMNYLAGGSGTTKGVDTGRVDQPNELIAEKAATSFQTVAIVSGEKDIIHDGNQSVSIHNGDQMLSRLTGTGCMSTSLIGSFSGITDNFFQAAIAGVSLMGIAGQTAARSLSHHEGIGTFKVRLMDSLSFIDGNKWLKEVHLRETTVS